MHARMNMLFVCLSESGQNQTGLASCSTQLRMIFKLLRDIEILHINKKKSGKGHQNQSFILLKK